MQNAEYRDALLGFALFRIPNSSFIIKKWTSAFSLSLYPKSVSSQAFGLEN